MLGVPAKGIRDSVPDSGRLSRRISHVYIIYIVSSIVHTLNLALIRKNMSKAALIRGRSMTLRWALSGGSAPPEAPELPAQRHHFC